MVSWASDTIRVKELGSRGGAVAQETLQLPADQPRLAGWAHGWRHRSVSWSTWPSRTQEAEPG